MSTSGDRREWSVFAGWRALLPCNSHFPLAALFLLYLLLDALASWALYSTSGPSASPYRYTTTFTDSLGGTFWLPEADGPLILEALFMSLIVSSTAQRAVFAVWIAFGSGKWYIRLAAGIIATACLYAAIQMPLRAPDDLWRDELIPYAAMPLELLSFAAPLALVAIWSGRRLQHFAAQPSRGRNARHFAISDILWITAVEAPTLKPGQCRLAPPAAYSSPSLAACFCGVFLATDWHGPVPMAAWQAGAQSNPKTVPQMAPRRPLDPWAGVGLIVGHVKAFWTLIRANSAEGL